EAGFRCAALDGIYVGDRAVRGVRRCDQTFDTSGPGRRNGIRDETADRVVGARSSSGADPEEGLLRKGAGYGGKQCRSDDECAARNCERHPAGSLMRTGLEISATWEAESTPKEMLSRTGSRSRSHLWIIWRREPDHGPRFLPWRGRW